MTDIVERLRKLNLAALRLEADNEATTIAEAGLEILRLRSELEQCQQAAFNAEEMRQALDGLYGACTRYDDDPDSPLVQARYGAARDFARSVLLPPPQEGQT